MILPQQCMQDVADIPKDLKRKIDFIPVSNMTEVLDVALVREPDWREDRAPERGIAASGAGASVPPVATARGRSDRS